MAGSAVSRVPGDLAGRYLATRQRLLSVARGALDLAAETGVEETATLETKLADELAAPFRFVVCGEVNAGKSTLLNAWFGHDLCGAGTRTREVEWFRHSDEERDEPETSAARLCFHRLPFLRNFHLVDTPGINVLTSESRTEIERLLSGADLLLAVFSVENPWSAATWEFVSKLPENILPRVAFVIQQADRREPEDLAVIGEHVRDLSRKRVGRELPVFAVSANRARQSETRVASGMAALETWIDREICESASRRAVLRETRDGTMTLLRRIEDRIEEQTRLAEDHDAFLRQLESEVEHEREKHTRKFSQKEGGLGDVLVREGGPAADSLWRRLGVVRSFVGLFGMDSTAAEMEKRLAEAAKRAMEERARADAQELVEVCRDHWLALQPRVRTRMGIEIPPFEEVLSGIGGTEERFVQRLGEAARHAVAHLKLRGLLGRQLQGRRAMLGRFAAVALALTTAAGIAGYLELPWVPWLILAAATVALLAGAVQAWRSRAEAVSEFAETVMNARHRFNDMVAEDYQNGVREFFIEYATMFEAVRRRIAEARQRLRPRMQRWNDLFLALKAIDQEL